MTPPVAAIDCGTNSTRLLIADGAGRTVTRLMRITRLGAGVDRRRALHPEAVARTLDVLRRYREEMDAHGVGDVRLIATSAARDAGNRTEFFAAAAEVVGVEPELLSGDDEARLSFAGATSDLAGGRRYLVADVGGGSTELAAGAGGGDADRTVSLDVGCVRVTERWLASDPPAPAEVAAAREAVAAVLARVEPPFAADELVGLAGTVSALAAYAQGLATYDRQRVHHHRLTRDQVEAMMAELASLPAAARAERPGIEPARADVIVGGAVVVAAVMAAFGFDSLITSESDILDGLALSLLRRSARR